MDNIEEIRRLLKQRDEAVEEIKRIVWESENPGVPYDPKKLFPWKRILRENDFVV